MKLWISAIVFLAVILMSACGKEKNDAGGNEADDTEQTEAALSPEEALSTSLVQGILAAEDEDLESFIENELYGELKSAGKVTIDRLSSSVFLIEFEKGGIRTTYIIRKYYDPSKEEFFFEKANSDSDILKQVSK